MRKQRRRKLREPARAGELVAHLLKGLGLEERLNQYKALVIWKDVVGPQIAARTRPVRIRNDILEINVDQPAWMQQLQLMKPKILFQLNHQLDKATIKDLYLKRGKIDTSPFKKSEPPPAWRMIKLDADEKRQVGELLSCIEDDGLKAEMDKYLQKQMRLLKIRDQKAVTKGP